MFCSFVLGMNMTKQDHRQDLSAKELLLSKRALNMSFQC